jgi:hypothetical protein
VEQDETNAQSSRPGTARLLLVAGISADRSRHRGGGLTTHTRAAPALEAIEFAVATQRRARHAASTDDTGGSNPRRPNRSRLRHRPCRRLPHRYANRRCAQPVEWLPVAAEIHHVGVMQPGRSDIFSGRLPILLDNPGEGTILTSRFVADLLQHCLRKIEALLSLVGSLIPPSLCETRGAREPMVRLQRNGDLAEELELDQEISALPRPTAVLAACEARSIGDRHRVTRITGRCRPYRVIRQSWVDNRS